MNNLYAVLHHNLIDPVGLDTWYFYPDGVRDNLSVYEFPHKDHGDPRYQPHVLFHFDQEPIDDLSDWKDYDAAPRTFWSQKVFRALANSEHSEVKKRVCRDRYMYDWYFFYHGFAALDWYRSGLYLDETRSISQVFSSYNHLINHKRSYRMALTARLYQKNLTQYGDISFHGTGKDCHDEINNDWTLLSDRDRWLIKKTLCNNSRLPLLVDNAQVNGNFSAHFSFQDYFQWQKVFVHVVNETVFYDPKLHLTEKIFKPIVAKRPFILVGAPGNLAYLRSYGFKTFTPWIDESYDDVTDPSQRLDYIATEIAKLCAKPLSDLKKIQLQMNSVLEHNKKHFFGEFRHVIVDELVENFDTCLRQWNNGRLDGREIPVVTNRDAIKALLAR
jgi:hypothetical protein